MGQQKNSIAGTMPAGLRQVLRRNTFGCRLKTARLRQTYFLLCEYAMVSILLHKVGMLKCGFASNATIGII
jgi:hypothetical protein